MAHDQPDTIPSQLMGYGDIASTPERTPTERAAAWKPVLWGVLAAVALFALYKLVRR